MITIMKKIILMLFVMSLSIGAFSQYDSALGLRGGIAQGITYKTFVGGSSAFDLILGTHSGGLNLTALYEIHSHDFRGVDNLSLFYGAGGHLGFYNSSSWPDGYWGAYQSGPVIGVDFVVGVEYTFDEIPINLSLDIVPSINITPSIFYWQRGALSIRYVFR